MKPTLLLLLISFSFFAHAQSDLLVLKQRNHIIKTWLPGGIINFQFSNKQWLTGIIKTVRNDSIWMDQIQIQQVPNQFGMPTLDTAHFGIMKFHVKEMYGMPKNDNAGIFTNGDLLRLGSGAFIFLNIVNTLIHGEAFFSSANATRLGIAAGVFLTGTLLHANHRTYIELGKKYTVSVISTR